MQYNYWPSLLSICIKSTNAITIVWGNRGRSFLSIGKLSGVIHTKRAKSNKPQCFPYCNLHATKVKTLQFSRFNKFYVYRTLSFSNFQLGQQHRVGLTPCNMRKSWHRVCFGLHHDTQTGKQVFKAACITIEPRQLLAVLVNGLPSILK